jgi:hypothetical protein
VGRGERPEEEDDKWDPLVSEREREESPIPVRYRAMLGHGPDLERVRNVSPGLLFLFFCSDSFSFYVL